MRASQGCHGEAAEVQGTREDDAILCKAIQGSSRRVSTLLRKTRTPQRRDVRISFKFEFLRDQSADDDASTYVTYASLSSLTNKIDRNFCGSSARVTIEYLEECWNSPSPIVYVFFRCFGLKRRPGQQRCTPYHFLDGASTKRARVLERRPATK